MQEQPWDTPEVQQVMHELAGTILQVDPPAQPGQPERLPWD